MESNREKILNEVNKITDETIQCTGRCLPDRKAIIDLVKEAQVILLPEFFHFADLSQEEAYVELEAGLEMNTRKTCQVLGVDVCSCEKASCFMEQLPHIKELVMSDLQAIYDGDPAAKLKAEIILCYPGFYATMIYRIAHVLYEMNIPFIPRVMAEFAHEKTGIDINPGASIGTHFCIDHGTGIVIGETATIGNHVKLYQGVTLGAKSFHMDKDGNPIKGGKRHPDIGDDVVIYANATILGGDTKIGSHSVIGSNVWLLHSVPEGSKVYYNPDLRELNQTK